MVKRRQPDTAAIEAFVAGVDQPVAKVAEPAPMKIDTAALAEAWPADLPKALQLRFKDPEVARMLQLLTNKLDRSQHDTAMRAFRRGLEQMLAE